MSDGFSIGIGTRMAARQVEAIAASVGDPRRNLATFSTAAIPLEGIGIHGRMLAYNAVNREEYPCVGLFESGCLGFLARRWNLQPVSNCAVSGMSTFGSSEAAQLAATALWWTKCPTGSTRTARPNLVMAANAHVCWRQLCRFIGIEPRVVAVHPRTQTACPTTLSSACDANTIGVVATLGATYTGLTDPIEDIQVGLDDLYARSGVDIDIHVDAASGGFSVPFLRPDREWDFRLPRVRSINTSGHKYGMVPPTLGWIMWRDRSALPDEMFCDSDYLSGSTRTLGLGYSRPAAHVAHQYFNILGYGVDGYTRILRRCAQTATALAAILDTDPELVRVSDPGQLPIVVAAGPRERVETVAAALHTRGWRVPTYDMPWSGQRALRIVCRPDMGTELADQLTGDLQVALRTTHRSNRIGAEPVAVASGGML
ncbi:pyridoxal-dependent decarboxylase [Nocardia sp. NBC_01503]|uniref:pyridoxal-dependent decarboxylase n=1 Tax=Nocardia sp. NBC_01503 TaxID=2975997 RepID=UPI002E7B2F4F|nr:pyridoxal-dependent decarboxylase [Nocardia sp. NBC_01503]WTL31447.1 pyridoxal-dependent decarboxylase [Nocardia sp. NBC_01503]